MGYWALDDVDSLMERSRKRLLRVVRGATGWLWFTQEGVASEPQPSREMAEAALRRHLEDTTQVPQLRRRQEAAPAEADESEDDITAVGGLWRAGSAEGDDPQR